MTRFLKNILLSALIILVLLSCFYVGLTIYGNLSNFGTIQSPETPEISKALYRVYIPATMQTYYTNSYQKNGMLYSIDGFWEVVKNRYRYNDSQLILDTNVFGEIRITERR